MKAEHLSEAIGNIDEKLHIEAAEIRKKKRRPRWIAWVAVAACIALALALARPFLHNGDSPSASPSTPILEAPASTGTSEHPSSEQADKTPLGTTNQSIYYDMDRLALERMIAAAEYPQMEQYPTTFSMQDWTRYMDAYERWLTGREEIRSSVETPQDESYFNDFYERSAAEFLKCNADENVVYSPTNVYMALSMLAELTEGESRQQILDLLGAESIEALRTNAKYLWTNNYSDDGVLTTVMANSLWLSEDLSYNRQTMDMLAEQYYASSFQGKMGSEEYDAVLRDWLNKQTGGLLKDSVNDLSFDPMTVMALASTIYFNGHWKDSFNPERTTSDIFHANNGDTTVDFMNGGMYGYAYWGKSFTAIQKGMQNGASMWLILPDEGKTVQDVLDEGEIFEMTAGKTSWPQSKHVNINLSMPKFDVTSNLDLVDGLKRLGVHDVFDYTVSDFTPMSDCIEYVYVSQAEHAARVSVDEDGCEAAAYAVMMLEATGAPIFSDTLDFILDRPFLFVITGCGDQPLFIGIVNQV